LLLPGEDPRHAMIPGDEIFQPLDRQATVITGRSGTTSGTGTDTARGQRSLLIRHTLTTFAPGSGVTAGASSASSDTIIGASGTHQLVINDTSGTGTSGTVSLNGGAAVNFSGTDTDLMVTGPNGEKVYVNTTAITPGFSGSVDLTADGTLSIDGGATSTAITFSANQQVIDSRDGTLVNLNTTSTTMAGTDELEFPGTSDIFAVVRQLKEDLLNSRHLETSARAESLNRRLSDVELVQNHLLDMVGVQSVSMEQMERLQTRTGDLKLAEKSDYSDTVSADISEAVLRLQELNNLQQFTMAAVSKLLAPNLLTYLQ
jgi:flagellin-like hook-associated protein FlgL